MSLPNRLSSGDKLSAEWLNNLLNEVKASVLLPGTGVTVSRLSNGTTINTVRENSQSTLSAVNPNFYIYDASDHTGAFIGVTGGVIQLLGSGRVKTVLELNPQTGNDLVDNGSVVDGDFVWIEIGDNASDWNINIGSEYPRIGDISDRFYIPLGTISVTIEGETSRVDNISRGWDGGDIIVPEFIEVTLVADGGDSGGDKADCTYTYTATTIDGVQLLTEAVPVNSTMRASGVEYQKATSGFVILCDTANYNLYTLNEYWSEAQLYLRPYAEDGYKVNLDAILGYLELTNADQSKQISLDLHDDGVKLNLDYGAGGTSSHIHFDASIPNLGFYQSGGRGININNGVDSQSIELFKPPGDSILLDLDYHKILVGNGTATAKMDVDGQTIYIEDGAGCSAQLEVNTGSLNVTDAAGTTISAALADLVAATTAKFQDITYVSDVFWDAGTLTLKQTKKTVRVLCVEPDAGTDSDILTGAKYPQTGTC
jgi:hypothetical protein